jgi:hypothetical protein
MRNRNRNDYHNEDNKYSNYDRNYRAQPDHDINEYDEDHRVGYGREEKAPWKGDKYDAMRNYGPDNYSAKGDYESNEARQYWSNRDRFASGHRDDGMGYADNYGRARYGRDTYGRNYDRDYDRDDHSPLRTRTGQRAPLSRNPLMNYQPLDVDRAYFGGSQGGQVSENLTPGDSDTRDPDYLTWRNAELARHDNAYRDWRTAQARSYDTSYSEWRKTRQDKFAQDFSDWRNQQSATPTTANSTGVAAGSTSSTSPGGSKSK